MNTRLLRLAGLLAIAGALLAAAPTQAGIGGYAPVQATCEYGRITVTSPQLNPSNNIALDVNAGLIIDPGQWVAFRASVARWNGSRWIIVASGDWKAMVATEGGSNLSDRWLNLRTNRWEAGTTTFSIRSRGYFTVWAEYHWYPAYSDPGGHVGLTKTPFHADYMNGSYMGSGDPYCHYR
jgi:hypothetical protein